MFSTYYKHFNHSSESFFRVSLFLRYKHVQVLLIVAEHGPGKTRSSHKHYKAGAKHAGAPRPRACTCLHGFHLVELSHQPVPIPVKQPVETTG